MGLKAFLIVLLVLWLVAILGYCLSACIGSFNASRSRLNNFQFPKRSGGNGGYKPSARLRLEDLEDHYERRRR